MESGVMSGKTVLITGATDGIGQQVAKEIAALGARIVIAGRSHEKCERTVGEVIAFSGNSDVHYLVADLSSMEEVRMLADAFQARYDRLDVLMNNAGASFLHRTWSVDGIEKTFALNHLAYFLLTNLLLDLLKSSAPSRIVNTSSGSAHRGKIRFKDIHHQRFYFVHTAYAQSKLANVMFTYALARRLEGSGVTANVFHPGLVRTGIFRKVKGVGPIIEWILTHKAIPLEEGAKTMVYLAASPEVEGKSGHFYYKKQIHETIEESYDVEAQERLWQISEDMVAKWL
jgi:NAD(P)-dependent dehydrogenase (short-subunit alcohol dehydrogenase family)